MLTGLDLDALIRLDPVAIRYYLGVISSYQRLPFFPETTRGYYLVNTDKLNGPGEHWTCLFFNGNGTCDYADSYGLPPLPSLYSQLVKDYGVRYAPTPYQGPFSLLCGLYAVFYACRRSRGLGVEDILIAHDYDYNDRIVCSYFGSAVSCSLWIAKSDLA